MASTEKSLMDTVAHTLITVMEQRRSIRHYRKQAVSDIDVKQLLWAGNHIPKAGGIRSLEIEAVPEQIIRQRLSSQECIWNAPVLLYISINDYKKEKYGRRGSRYALLEAGHAAQNICLMATALGLGCVVVGAFRDSLIKELLDLRGDPIYLIPVGYPENHLYV